MGKIIGMAGSTVKSDAEDLKPKYKTETDAQWLRRIASELRRQLPALRTVKIEGGRKRIKKVDHYDRLVLIAKVDGHAGVQIYVDQQVKLYNEQLEKLKAKNNLYAR